MNRGGIGFQRTSMLVDVRLLPVTFGGGLLGTRDIEKIGELEFEQFPAAKSELRSLIVLSVYTQQAILGP